MRDGGLVASNTPSDYEDPKRFIRGLRPVRERLVRQMAEDGLKVTGECYLLLYTSVLTYMGPESTISVTTWVPGPSRSAT